jgi:hypothetical protein
MPLPKLNLDVPQEGYSFDDGDGVLRAKLSSGSSRQRLDMIDAPIEADVTLMLGPAEYQYWRVFHRYTLVRGTLPFLLDLVVDSSATTEHEVKIIPGTMQTGVQGEAHIIQFRLEVLLSDDDEESAEAILMLYALYGDQAAGILEALAQLVNVQMPDALA